MVRPATGPGSSTETRAKGFTSSSNGNPLQQNALTVEAADRSNNWLKDALETLAVLREWYPGAFATGRLRPLKVGIDKDIAERAPAITAVERARALRYHTKSDRYLRALRPGAARVDLDGVEVGAVTPDDAAHAKAIFNSRKAKQAARLAATQPQIAPVVEPPPRPAPLAASAPTKRERDLEQAKADRERYRRARGLGVRA